MTIGDFDTRIVSTAILVVREARKKYPHSKFILYVPTACQLDQEYYQGISFEERILDIYGVVEVRAATKDYIQVALFDNKQRLPQTESGLLFGGLIDD